MEYEYSNNILPIPIDQRYGKEEMIYIDNQLKVYDEIGSDMIINHGSFQNFLSQ